MAQVPTNQKLYAMVVMQAKAKYHVYPSPGASHWVHKRYLELGGKFTDTEIESRKKELVKRFLEERQRKMGHQFHGKRHGGKDDK